MSVTNLPVTNESHARAQATQPGDAHLEGGAHQQVAELDAPHDSRAGVDVSNAKVILDDFESRVNEEGAECVEREGRMGGKDVA